MPQFFVRRLPKPRPGQEPLVFYTAERSNENQSGLSAAVRQPQKNPIAYKSIPKSANSTAGDPAKCCKLPHSRV